MNELAKMTNDQIDARIKELMGLQRETLRKLAASKRSHGDLVRAEQLERMVAMDDRQLEAALNLIGGLNPVTRKIDGGTIGNG